MATRHISSLLALGLAVSSTTALLYPTVARAQELPEEKVVPQVDNAKHRFIGQINDNAAFVRSGPSNNFYSTAKLQKGDKVTVVGIKYEWLKIVPPEGSFSYIPQAYVTRRGDGKIGRVNQTANVRAGSSLNGVKTTVQVKLEPDTDVTILGEQDEYFKIAPPEGAYVYIHQQYVDPVGRADAAADELAQGASDKTPAEAPVAVEPGDAADVNVTETPTKPEAVAGAAQTQPADAVAVTETPADPATKPAAIAVATADDFGKLEADYKALNETPLADRQLEPIIARHEALLAGGKLSGMQKRLVDARLKALRGDLEARDELRNFYAKKQEATAKLTALEGERKELEERSKQTQIDLYAAVGTLRVSSLQQGTGGLLYRLTDPSTGRTLVYLRSADPQFSTKLNQFVGVRGDIKTDERLKAKIMAVDEANVVDPSKVNNGVIATITPPSLLPQSVEIDQQSATE